MNPFWQRTHLQQSVLQKRRPWQYSTTYWSFVFWLGRRPRTPRPFAFFFYRQLVREVPRNEHLVAIQSIPRRLVVRALAEDGVLEVPLLKTAAPALAASEVNPRDAGANLNPNGSAVVVVVMVKVVVMDVVMVVMVQW